MIAPETDARPTASGPAGGRPLALSDQAPPGTVTRFAPSPTGRLHLGHAHAALFAWTLARRAGGRFLVRLEDLDLTRCRPEYARAALDDLAWLGLDWDAPVRVQSEHFGEYRAALESLDVRGLLYPCFCTRADLARETAAAAGAPHEPPAAPYPGTCRGLPGTERARRIAAGAPYALRLDMAAAMALMRAELSFEDRAMGRVSAEPSSFGDVVLARRDAPASYHLCATHDDAAQGITLVTRAIDLQPAAHLHCLLQALFGWPVPAYAHHPLLTDANGRRLAKRDGALSLAALREAGHDAAAVRAMAGF